MTPTAHLSWVDSSLLRPARTIFRSGVRVWRKRPSSPHKARTVREKNRGDNSLATEIRVIYKSAMLAGVAGLALASAALAQAPKSIQFDIPPEDLGTALNEVARQSHQEVIFNADLTRGKQAPALRGDFNTEQALQQLLTGTDLSAKLSANGSFVVERGGPLAFATTEGAPAGPPQEIATVTVTGTRIVRNGYSAPT